MSCNNLELTDANCFSVDIGRDYLLNMTYDDGATPPVAIDLTGFDLAMNIKLATETVNFLTLGIVGDLDTTGIFLADPTTGVFQIVITEADTATATATDYNYEIVITDPASKETTFLYGLIKFAERLP